MGLNINLFVHGVPMGQKIWGPKGDDERYLSSFYGPKWDAPEVMKIDVMTFGGSTQCYYSFVKGQNVCDSQGRAGSYFALTVRINAFYADVQNIYNILKAVYDKMCVGLCVQENNGSAKYMIADFQSIDGKLKEIEKHVLNYISEFSIVEDIISLAGFSSNSQSTVQTINLFECDKMTALDVVKKSGRLFISPCYLSSSAAKTVAQYKAEMQTTIQKAQQEISLTQKSSQEKIESITRKSKEELEECQEQSRKRLEQVKEENDRKIASIKQEYEEVDTKIESLKQTIKEREKDVSDLQMLCRKKDKEIKNNNEALLKSQQRVDKLKNDLNSVRMGDMTPVMPPPRRINWLIVGIVSFFIVLLVGSLGFFAKKYYDANEVKINGLQTKILQLEHENDSLKNPIVAIDAIDVPTLPEGFDRSKIKIEIQEFGKKKKSITRQEICHISIQGEGASDLQGEWISEGAGLIIRDGTIMVKDDYKGSTCTLLYVLGKDTIASREIEIQQE